MNRTGRPKKSETRIPLSCRLEGKTYTRLARFCDITGMPKTTALERAVNMYIDEFENGKNIYAGSSAMSVTKPEDIK